MKKIVPAVLVVIVIITGLTIVLSGSRCEELTLAMTYIPNVQFAPWYVAEEKGFFREENLKVKFDYRMDIDALQLVAAGKMDFAVAGGDQVITARSRGIPVVYLSTLYAKFPPTVIALEGSNISKPLDLRGKRVGLPLYGTNLLAMKAILYKSGLKEEEVQLVDIGYTQIPSLVQKKVDAVVGFANNEPVKLRNNGYRITEIHSWDYFSLVGHGLITGEKFISSSPDIVKRMVRATIKGMKYTLEHPDEAFEICLKYLPELGEKEKAVEREVLRESIKLWENDYTLRFGLGHSDPKAWEESQRIMAEMGLIKKTTPVEDMLNQTFLP